MAITPKNISPQDIANAKKNISKTFKSGPRGRGTGVASGQKTSPLKTQPLQAAQNAAKMFPDALANGPQQPIISPFSVSEQQEENITATGGTRTLAFLGQTTSALAFDADPATLKSALEGLSTIGAGNISVEGFESVNEAQSVTLGVGNTGGTFTLTFAGQTTAGIAFNAPASAVASALAALSTIGAGNVAVTGNAGGPYTVTFQGTLAKTNVPKMTATGSLTGGANTVTVASTGTNRFTNKYLFIGALADQTLPKLVVNPAALTGGTSTITVTATPLSAQAKREDTQKALAASGNLRSPSQVNNDLERFNQRKPIDIGQPGRVAGEDFKNLK